MRTWLVRLHRWFGLTAAIFLTLAGLTGALIAWDHELDGWLAPEFHEAIPASAAPTQSPLVLAQRLEASDARLKVSWLPLAVEPGEALLLGVVPRADPRTGQPYELGFSQVAINPVTGAVQGRRMWGAFEWDRAHLMPFIYQLHYSLHLPEWGGVAIGIWLMGCLAIAWVLDTLFALYLSFPNWRQWRKSLAFRWQAGGHKLVFDLHRSGGVWLWLLVLMVAVTSVAMNLRDPVMKPVVNWFSPLTVSRADSWPAPKGEPAGLEAHSDLVLQRAHDEALRRGLAAPLGGLFIRPGTNVWSVGFYEPGDSHGDGGLGNVWMDLDALTGQVLGVSVPGQGSAGDVFLQAMFPLHSGRILGSAGRVVMTLMGLAIAAFSITGVMLWMRKRAARAAGQAARPTALKSPSSSCLLAAGAAKPSSGHPSR